MTNFPAVRKCSAFFPKQRCTAERNLPCAQGPQTTTQAPRAFMKYVTHPSHICRSTTICSRGCDGRMQPMYPSIHKFNSADDDSSQIQRTPAHRRRFVLEDVTNQCIPLFQPTANSTHASTNEDSLLSETCHMINVLQTRAADDRPKRPEVWLTCSMQSSERR